jgi:DNA-binding PadR family transcriptional regulator
MGRGGYLGEFEQIVLLAVARLDEDAYGMRIRAEIEERAGRRASIGAVYATLERLVSKGYARETDVAGGSERSGLARRFYALTPSGRTALEGARDLQDRMWAGLKLKTERRKP